MDKREKLWWYLDKLNDYWVQHPSSIWIDSEGKPRTSVNVYFYEGVTDYQREIERIKQWLKKDGVFEVVRVSKVIRDNIHKNGDIFSHIKVYLRGEYTIDEIFQRMPDGFWKISL